MKTFSLTRQELYEQVWSKPMVTLAKEYSLSDNGLRKMCKKYDVPIPPMGHWQKIQFNKKTTRIPLPKKEKEEEIKINVQDSKLIANTDNPLKNAIVEKIKNNSSLILKVADRLSKPDDIIVKTQANIEKKKVSESYSPLKGTVQTDKGFPSIIVSPKNISRSLRILDNLIKNFRLLGYKIDLWEEGLKIVAYDDDKMSIYIREKSNAVDTTSDYGWKSRELVPNGKLSVKVQRFGTFEFTDTNKSLVEDQIEKILVKIESEFQEMFEKRQQWKLHEQKQEDLRKIELAKQKLKEDELNKFTGFFNDAHRWKKFTILKEYHTFLESQENKSAELQEWLSWAKSKLDWYNPMVELEDELLSGVDKDNLTFKKKSGNNLNLD
tara:strand:- start:13270 stop:14409 length:1140 start_codon:yes stop_codon:yes gene_type:complete